jgi:hypothetical protein
MSKAFDKVNHKHLLHKLRMAGFGGSLLQWFQSYLTNRHQRVTAQGSTSTTLTVTSGVPQGSIFSPVLFSLYVNDHPDAITSGHVAMFADDIKLFHQRQQTASKRSQNLETWSEESGHKFNMQDTTCTGSQPSQINYWVTSEDHNVYPQPGSETHIIPCASSATPGVCYPNMHGTTIQRTNTPP